MKPEPPDNFWETLRADADKLNHPPENRPENSKTLAEISQGLGISDSQARRILRRLVMSGLWERLGKSGSRNYYRRVDDNDQRDR